MIKATRWVTIFLTIVSVVFLVAAILLAALLSTRVLRALRRSESRFRAIFEPAGEFRQQLRLDKQASHTRE